MKTKTIIYVILAIVVLSNTPPVQFFLEEKYCYQNKDASFRYCEIDEKALSFEVGLLQFQDFQKEHPNNPNTTLYRTFKIKPWQFWEWWQYIAHHERFTLPYLENKK